MQNSGRISYLDPSSTVTPEEAQRRRRELASLVIRGYNRKALAEHFGVHRDTISTWTQRPDVQALITSLGRQRTDRLIHRVDAELEARLEKVRGMDLDDIIKIRKEIVPQRIEVADKTEDAKALQELMEEMWGKAEDESESEPDSVRVDRGSGPDEGR
jgi:transposase